MAMKVHGALGHDMDHFIKECVHLFHDRQSGGHLSLSFKGIQFFKQVVNIALQRALASAIEGKIALASDACSRPPITIKSHDLHVGYISKAMGEIVSYHERDYLFPSFWALQALHLLAFLWPSFFVSPGMVSTIDLLLDFCFVIPKHTEALLKCEISCK
jgi:hypothetical protein